MSWRVSLILAQHGCRILGEVTRATGDHLTSRPFLTPGPVERRSQHDSEAQDRPALVGLSRRSMLAGVTGLGTTALLTSCSWLTKQKGVAGSPFTHVPPQDRKNAPAISGTSLDGTPLALQDFLGQVVVLNVWGSWCTPCVLETPALVSTATKTSAAFLGINTNESRDNAKAFVRTHRVPYPSFFDPNGELLLQFAGIMPVTAIPSTLVVDTDGRVAVRILSEVSEITLVQLVEEVAAGK